MDQSELSALNTGWSYALYTLVQIQNTNSQLPATTNI